LYDVTLYEPALNNMFEAVLVWTLIEYLETCFYFDFFLQSWGSYLQTFGNFDELIENLRQRMFYYEIN